MTENELSSVPQTPEAPAAKPAKAMPRPAIAAIAYSGYFCAVTSAFLAYFAWRMGYHMAFVVLNVLTAIFLTVGSQWMLNQLKKTAA
jgi:hypothetical protein